MCTSKASKLSSSTTSQHTSAYVSIRQHTYVSICVLVLVKQVKRVPAAPRHHPQLASIRQHTSAYARQYMCTCTSKASKVKGEYQLPRVIIHHQPAYVSIRQHTPAYIRQHMCTSKASKGSTSCPASSSTISTRFTVSPLDAASAYVSIRQHTSAYASISQHTHTPYHRLTPPLHTSAYVSIRQHTPA
jgi:hypothetical protein